MRTDERIAASLLPFMYGVMRRPYPAMIEEFRSTETLSEDELATLRLTRLQRLLEHSYANVPYYRSLFESIGAEPGDIRSFDEYAQLPTIDKSTLRERASELVAATHPVSDLTEVWTSGSTATPVMLYYDAAYFDHGWAALMRNMEWTGFTHGERQMWLTREDTGGWQRVVRLAVERKWVAGVVVQTPETIAKWAAELQRVQPRLVYSTPSSRLSELSAHLLERDIRLQGIRGVMTSSETLLEHTRALIEDAFGTRVYDQYGSTECLSIACECPAGSMHINAQINHVEYLPVDAAPGTYEMVVTPLMSYGMPLLRYRLGDFGAPVEGRCACGRTLPMMRMQAGRTAATVTLSDGSQLTPFSLEELVHDVNGIVRFQFRQVEPDVFDLLVVKASPGDALVDEALRDLSARFERSNGIRVAFNLHYVDEIPLTEAGKHLYVVPLERETPR